MSSNTFWDQLASAEAYIVEMDRGADLSHFSRVPLAFFVHRSILTTTAELRSHKLWRDGKQIKDETDPAASLVKIYLDHYGPLGTFTNLILEAEATAPSIHRTVVLDLSAEVEQSGWSDENEVLKITVSQPLRRALGEADDCWAEINSAVRQPLGDAQFIACRKRLQALDSSEPLDALSLLGLWTSEGEFFSELVRYSTGASLRDLRRDETALGAIRLWLRAIRATFLFRGIGRTWYTAPTKSPFADLLQSKVNMRAPLSSWSALTEEYSPQTVTTLSNLVETRVAENTRASKPLVDMMSVVAGDRTELPRLEHIKDLAASLIGSDHEGKPLSFTFLCCNDTEFLRWHVTLGPNSPARKRWGLRIRQALTPMDFGSDQVGAKAQQQVKKAVQGNSLILQQQGYSLWFSPVVGTDGVGGEAGVSLAQYRPNAIVELVGDRMDREEIHRVLTETMPYAALIHIDHERATLYKAGKRCETCGGRTPLGGWKETPEQPLIQYVVQAAQSMQIAGATQDEVRVRVEKVMAAAEEVARQQHGALFFLWNGQPTNDTTPLSLAWGWASRNNYLELVDVATLAAKASLDGETVVNLATGQYGVRQFTHPKSTQTMSFIDLENGNITKALLDVWAEAPKAQDDPVDLWNFGTRHQKALRVTWKQLQNVIAVTVSASGPIRIWRDGKPVHKGVV